MSHVIFGARAQSMLAIRNIANAEIRLILRPMACARPAKIGSVIVVLSR